MPENTINWLKKNRFWLFVWLELGRLTLKISLLGPEVVKAAQAGKGPDWVCTWVLIWYLAEVVYCITPTFPVGLLVLEAFGLAQVVYGFFDPILEVSVFTTAVSVFSIVELIVLAVTAILIREKAPQEQESVPVEEVPSESKITCPYCGSRVSSSKDNCSNCGGDLSSLAS